jgi:hypothetical protein
VELVGVGVEVKVSLEFEALVGVRVVKISLEVEVFVGFERVYV